MSTRHLNKQQLERKWNAIEIDYVRRYPDLREEDVNYGTGEFDNMTERIAKRTNRTRQQVTDEIRDWGTDWEDVNDRY